MTQEEIKAEVEIMLSNTQSFFKGNAPKDPTMSRDCRVRIGTLREVLELFRDSPSTTTNPDQ